MSVPRNRVVWYDSFSGGSKQRQRNCCFALSTQRESVSVDTLLMLECPSWIKISNCQNCSPVECERKSCQILIKRRSDMKSYESRWVAEIHYQIHLYKTKRAAPSFGCGPKHNHYVTVKRFYLSVMGAIMRAIMRAIVGTVMGTVVRAIMRTFRAIFMMIGLRSRSLRAWLFRPRCFGVRSFRTRGLWARITGTRSRLRSRFSFVGCGCGNNSNTADVYFRFRVNSNSCNDCGKSKRHNDCNNLFCVFHFITSTKIVRSVCRQFLW